MKLKFILPHDLSNSPDRKEVNRIDKGKIPTDVGRSTMYRWGFRKFTTAEQIARKIC